MISSFLEKLPLEIRLEIYRYLVGRHTRSDHAMKSKAYNQNRSVIFGPDHSYQFHDSILHVNRQTRREALEVLRSETMLISLLIPRPVERFATIHAECWATKMSSEIKECGVVTLYREDLDCLNPPFAMSIEMIDRFRPTEESMYFVFPADDLPAACVFLQRKIQESNDNSGDVNIRVQTCPSVIETASLLQDGASPKVETKLSKCLEPLKQIRGASQVDIDGPTSHYTAALIAAMTDQRRSVKETMDLVAAHFDRGDQYLLEGAWRRAITEYKTACLAMEMDVFDETEVNKVLIGGRFHGLLAGWARDDSKVRLHAKIASTYLQLGQHRMATIYVERICFPVTFIDYTGHSAKYDLDLPADQNPVAYAELLFVAASISLANGSEYYAQWALHEAILHDPRRGDILELWEQCNTRVYARRQRREKRRKKTQGEQERSFIRKCKADVKVAGNRIAKADELFRMKRVLEARGLYEAAYQKVRDHTDDAEGKAFIAESLTKLTRLSMELQDDKAARHWVYTIIALGHQFEDTSNGYETAGVYQSRITEEFYPFEAIHTAYYSKAVMLQRQGKITEAAWNFEWALESDSGCHATYYQLENLKRAESAERDILRIWETRWPGWEKMDEGGRERNEVAL